MYLQDLQKNTLCKRFFAGLLILTKITITVAENKYIKILVKTYNILWQSLVNLIFFKANIKPIYQLVFHTVNLLMMMKHILYLFILYSVSINKISQLYLRILLKRSLCKKQFFNAIFIISNTMYILIVLFIKLDYKYLYQGKHA